MVARGLSTPSQGAWLVLWAPPVPAARLVLDLQRGRPAPTGEATKDTAVAHFLQAFLCAPWGCQNKLPALPRAHGGLYSACPFHSLSWSLPESTESGADSGGPDPLPQLLGPPVLPGVRPKPLNVTSHSLGRPWGPGCWFISGSLVPGSGLDSEKGQVSCFT